ncbi:glycosyltransferase [Nostoc sp. NIES-2111]
MTTFSIVIPFYNRRTALQRCIASVTSQNFESFEVIAVDDGSEEAERVVEDFEDPRVCLIRQPNRGAGAARNTGLGAATGDYVIYLDSDDELVPGALDAFWSASHGGTLDLMVGHCLTYQNGAWSNRAIRRPYHDNVADSVVDTWLTGSVAIRRILHPVVSETRMPWEMAECFLTAASRSPTRVGYTDATVVRIHRNDEKGLSAQTNHMEPFRAGLFWAEMKERFSNNRMQDEAFDQIIFLNAFAIFHEGDPARGEQLFGAIDRDKLPNYSWYGPFKIAWYAHRFGFRTGLSIQFCLASSLSWLRDLAESFSPRARGHARTGGSV